MPFLSRVAAYSYAFAWRSSEGTPQLSIMFHGLIPVPPPEPSMVRRSSLASAANRMAIARASMP